MIPLTMSIMMATTNKDLRMIPDLYYKMSFFLTVEKMEIPSARPTKMHKVINIDLALLDFNCLINLKMP